ncbi:nuclear transport factor 2 family protein [Rhodococcus qingshengii]|uniref:nuclear transport factor 2 family protein n=1 Tax=Rhodococcus qingshengii TaxID=334542 RepID=UPI001455F782|nr:nuclear transport factor 2 family protein [Rhodococcus qingshengii]
MTEPKIRESPLDDVASILEIKQLKAQYCYCVDHKDWARWACLFTTDGLLDERGSAIARDPITNERVPVAGFSFEFFEERDVFDWPLRGREAIQSFGETIAANNRTIHHIFEPEIELTSANTAKAKWPMEDYVWYPEGSPIRYSHGMGYYHETYERIESGKWLFKTINFSRSWMDVR